MSDAWRRRARSAESSASTFYDQGPASEAHHDASQQLWIALERLAAVRASRRAESEVDATEWAEGAARGALERASGWVPPGAVTRCARCGRALTDEAIARGLSECSAHMHGKVEIQRPRK